MSAGPVPSRYSTVALSEARLTLAEITPGTLDRASSTRATQEAQVIPPTGNMDFLVATPSPNCETVSLILARSTFAGSYSREAFCDAKLTSACSTPGVWDRPFAIVRAQVVQVIPVMWIEALPVFLD